MDPGKAGIVTRTPDDVLYIQDPAVRQQRLSIPYSHHSRNPFDTCVAEVDGTYSNKRSGMEKHFRSKLSADRRAQCQDVMTDESDESYQEKSAYGAIDSKGYVAELLAR
jgi:hypothetical protein